MGSAETEVQLRAWMDRLAIQDLIFRYSDAVTRADWDACLRVFAPDAVWESPGMGMRFESPAAFVGLLTQTSSTSELLIQTAHGPVIDLIGSDWAKSTTTVHEVTRGVVVGETSYGEEGSEINFAQYGIYFDDIARIDGEWKFTHRVFVPLYVSSGSVTGNVMTPRTALMRPEVADLG